MRKHPTIGCCGIDCGLCPRYYTQGDSACPGCGGTDFYQKHPSCGFLSCCSIKKNHEVCSYCTEYPCKRFDAEKEGYDSFVTHRKIFSNLDAVKTDGIDSFIEKQTTRIDILNEFLTHFDDGRSKSFYCLSCALLPIEHLQKAHAYATGLTKPLDLKEKSKSLKLFLLAIADSLSIDLKLNKKKTTH